MIQYGHLVESLDARNPREQRTVSLWQGVGAYVELRRSSLQRINLVSIMQGLPGYAPVKGLKFE